jgi:hypothetical protein
VYVGLETGDPSLLRRLGKAGTPEDAAWLVGSLHEADVSVGVIVLLGAAGASSADAHIRATVAVLRGMELGRPDIVYLSEYRPEAARLRGRGGAAGSLPSGRQGERAADSDTMARERSEIASALRSAAGPRIAPYDLRELTY